MQETRESIKRRPTHGTLINWSIDKVLGVSFVTGTAVRPHEDQSHPPHAENVRMELLWDSHGCFGCHDGVDPFKGHTHVFKKGEPALDPFPYLTRLVAAQQKKGNP
jgi:hypothetical protein